MIRDYNYSLVQCHLEYYYLCFTQKCDMTFTSIILWMSSGGRSWNDMRGTIPALLISTSTVPMSRFTFAYSSTTSLYLLTSA